MVDGGKEGECVNGGKEGVRVDRGKGGAGIRSWNINDSNGKKSHKPRSDMTPCTVHVMRA